MRILWLLMPFTLAAQETVIAPPRVGQIEFYGLKRLTAERIQREAGLKAGMTLPPSQPDLVERIVAIKDVAQASVEAVCCERNQAVLFVGVEEKGAPRFDIREPAALEGQPMLPEDLLDAYRHLLDAMANAARAGDTAEDISRGHSLLRDESARGWQLRVQQLVEPNVDLLRKTLRMGNDEERAVAALAIGYAENKKLIMDDLQFALRDPDPTVRANALRSILPVIQLARANPQLGIRPECTWIVETLHSVFFQDRQNAVKAMLALTETNAPDNKARELLFERALEPLAEMARWRHLPNALPAFLLLGRALGKADAEIEKEWLQGDREAVIRASLEAVKEAAKKEQRKR